MIDLHVNYEIKGGPRRESPMLHTKKRYNSLGPIASYLLLCSHHEYHSLLRPHNDIAIIIIGRLEDFGVGLLNG